MRRLLVSQRVTEEVRYRERRDALDQRWSQLLFVAGFATLPVPNQPRLVDPMLGLPGLSGVVLTGGASLAVHGGQTPERDETERRLLVGAMDRGLPVLGVCRGMQLIADHLGGALVAVPGHVGPEHQLRTGGEGPVARAIEAGTWVNSYHELGLVTCPGSLRPIAHAEDGSIEAVAHVELAVFGVMWHPERGAAPGPAASVALLHAVFGAGEPGAHPQGDIS